MALKDKPIDLGIREVYRSFGQFLTITPQAIFPISEIPSFNSRELWLFRMAGATCCLNIKAKDFVPSLAYVAISHMRFGMVSSSRKASIMSDSKEL